MKKLCLVALVTLALAGCKSEITLPVKYSEVFGTQKLSLATLRIEVPSCQAGKKKLESRQVGEAKKNVNEVFASAQYLGCRKEGSQSFVSFEVPFRVGGVGLNDCGKDQICVASSQNNLNMNVFVGEEVRKKINEMAKNLPALDPNDLKITLEVVNDSGKDLSVTIPSAFLNHQGKIEPVHYLQGASLTKGKISMTLSNVATVQAAGANGVATVISFPEREKKEVPDQ